MKYIACVFSFALIMGGIAAMSAAQTTPNPRFEVASIKAKGPFRPSVIGVQFLPGGLLRASNATIPLLLMEAYRISPQQMDFKKLDSQTGFRELMNEMFDIDAKAGINEPPESVLQADRRHQHALMLQALLADRFKLALHKESREMPIYALVVAPNGPKFQPSLSDRPCADQKPDDPFTARFGTSCGTLAGGPAGGVKGFNVDIAKLVETLEEFGDRLVVDRTGIQGRFDIDLPPWTRSLNQPVNDGREPAYEDANGPTIFNVLQQNLGLRLESTRGPVDMYVIDHVEKPDAN